MFLLKYKLILFVFISVQSQEFARQQIQSYVSCQTDADCKENSFCYGNDDNRRGKCKCKQGFELQRNLTFYECLPRVNLGDACQEDYQCKITATPLAICNKFKICECGPDSHPFDNRCYSSIKLGELCISDANCYLSDGTFAFCEGGYCTCGRDSKPSFEKNLCLSMRKFGEPCKTDQECESVANSKCREKCVCDTEYTLSRNATECIKAATEFGESCDFDGQCSKFLEQSACNNRKCGCAFGFHEYGPRCVVTKRIGQDCEKNEECIYKKEMAGNVRCEAKKCICLFGKQENGDCNTEKILDIDDGNGASNFFVTKAAIFGLSSILFVLIL